jgi:phosphatidylinositol alpha-mannosyltransferase
MAEELDIAEATVFVGRVSEAEKRALFARSAVFCSPASGGESQGVVLLESMALGTPVVASDIAGYRTVINPGSDGLLARPGDPAALAAEIRRVLSDPQLGARLAAAGRATVERRYDWRIVIPQHVAEYRAAIRAWKQRESGAQNLARARFWGGEERVLHDVLG